MKIYKDILEALRIETVFILANKLLYMCFPVEIKKNTWIVSCDSSNLEGDVIFKIKFNGSFINLNSRILKKDKII